MFEREIKFIYDFNLNKISRLGPYFTFEQLASTEVHPAILSYISAEIDYLVFEDRQKLLKNSVFDYSGEKISYHFTQITEELKKSKRFAVEYIAKLILHGSSFTINYLIRPKWTLTRFVFDEEKLKTSNEIKQILNYVYYYKYLTKILISYINTKKILSMNIEEFETLLNKADSIGVENYLPAILTNSLKSMSEFFNIGEVKKNRIPLPAVEMFLEEKELISHLKALNETFGSDENARFNLADYQKILSHVMLEKKEAQPLVEEREEFETSEIEAPVIMESPAEFEEEQEEMLEEEEIEVDEKTDEVSVEEVTISEQVEELIAEEPIIEQEIDSIKHEEEVPVEELLQSEEIADEEKGISENEFFEENPIDLFKGAGVNKFESESLLFEEIETEAAPISDAPDKIVDKQHDEKPSEKTEEISSPPDEDIIIKTPKKFRIRMKDDAKIEPIFEDESSSGDNENKLDLFKDFGLFDEVVNEEIKEEEELEIESEIEEKTLFDQDFEASSEEEKEEISKRFEMEIPFEEIKKSEDDEPVDEIGFSSMFPQDDENIEHELENEEETEMRDNATNAMEIEISNFHSLLNEQQKIFLEDDNDIEEHEEKVDFDDYESEASKKLDERISEEKPEHSDESMFDVIRQNFIDSKESNQKVDLAEILERKEMTKIIEVIFDYDIEDFAEILDEISNCRNVDDAHLVINQALMDRHINRNSKEAETFRTIITDFFEKD